MAVRKELNIQSITGKVGPSMAKVTKYFSTPFDYELVHLCLVRVVVLHGWGAPSITDTNRIQQLW